MSTLIVPSVSQEFFNELARTAKKASFASFESIGNALKYLETNGLPTSKNEDYKYCNIEALIRREFKKLDGHFLPLTKTSTSTDNNTAKEIRLNLWNGEIVEDLTQQNFPEEIVIASLRQASENYPEIFYSHFGKHVHESSDALIAMNTAYSGDGLYIHVRKNAAIRPVIRITHIGAAEGSVAQHHHHLIILEENAQVKIIHEFLSNNSGAKYFSNHLTEIALSPSSHLELVTLQNAQNGYYGFHTIQSKQQSNSVLRLNTITLDGNFIRNNVNAVVQGENAETNLNGLTLSTSGQLVDHHTLVDHAAPNCTSNELYKGIATDKSTLIFNGKIQVRRDSQKINAYQSSKNILLSDDATVNTKPQLEILANDVKCSHGTSTGKLDESALFYLKSRGIGRSTAKKLLLHAFASEILSKVEIDFLQTELQEKVETAIESAC